MEMQKTTKRTIAGQTKEKFPKKEIKVTAKDFANAVVNIYLTQEQSGDRRSAHNAQHMLRTAIAGSDYALENPSAYKADTKKVAKLAAITGIVHDLVRMPHEIEGREDGIVTADFIEHIAGLGMGEHKDVIAVHSQLAESHPNESRTISEFLKASITGSDINLIAQAIRVNEGKVTEVMEAVEYCLELGRNEEALLYEALMFGDKGVEGLGPAVVVRRAQFVSGERAENPEDIGKLKHDVLQHAYTENEYRLLAFIGESMIRIYSGKKLDDFPSGCMWDEVKKSREFELKVYQALLEHFDIKDYQSEQDIFRYLLNMGFPKMKKSEEKIREGIDSAERFSSIECNFRKDAINLVLGLAYSQSKDPDLKAKSNPYLSQVKDEELKNIAASSDIQELKQRFGAYFE